MSALDECIEWMKEDESRDAQELAEKATADLAALNARVKTAEENWHKNEARVAKLKLAIINALNPGEPKALEILEAALKGAE